MESPSDHRTFIWSIDGADKIVYVNDDWLAFAQENSAPQLSAALVLNQPLWRFIQGQETIYLYRQILSKVRAGKTPVEFPFRCDSPDCRRYMEMKLSILSGNAVQFLARILRQQYRQPLELLGASQDRSGEYLTICSWCKKIFITGRRWREIEEAIGILDLFGNHSMPKVTHTICDSCYDLVKHELDRESDTRIDRN